MSTELAPFSAIKSTVDAALIAAKALIITDAETAEAASLRRKELKEIGKRVESIRKELVKPFDDGKAGIQKLAKSLSDPLETADKNLTTKLLAYQNELRMQQEAKAAAERAEAERKAAEIAANDGSSLDEVEKAQEVVEYLAQPIKLSKSEKLVSTRMVWKYRVTDKSLLPADLLIPDTAEIYKRVQEGARAIPGCEIYEEETPTGR